MKNILFVNACVREQSRTLALARHILDGEDGAVSEVELLRENLRPLNRETLTERDELLRTGRLDAPMLRYARQFAAADKIVIAAPFWDLSFPAMLKTYLEAVTVTGITFRYTPEGRPEGLCRARELVYVTTSGGPITENFGYSYVKALARTFYGIPETVSYRAEMLDVLGVPMEAVPDGIDISVIR